ncbi:MAG: glycosyltransferase family 39 protein [Chloroflexota bacterium]
MSTPSTPSPALDDASPVSVIPAASGGFRARAHRYAGLFALLAFALMIAAALDFRTASGQQFLASGSLKMILGALALGAAVRLSDRLPPLGKPLDVALDPARRFWWAFAGAGALLLFAVAEINGQVLHALFLKDVSSHLQYLLLVGGIVLVAYGLAGAPSLRLRRVSIDGRTLLPLAAIMALALFLRLWNQAGTVRVLIDELHWSDAIMAVEGRPTLQILAPMSAQSPYTWLFPYWQAGAVRLLGHNFVGFRFTSAVIGTLTVWAAYGLARALFDRKTALLCALILATFPPHVHFSRVAMTLIADPFFGTLALMFIARALRNNRRLEWALAGVSLGMTQYFYEGGRLLFPPLVVGFVILLALGGVFRRSASLRGKWRGIAIALTTAVLVGAPVYYTIIGQGKPLFGRFDDSGLGSSYWQQLSADGISPQDVVDQVAHVLTSFMIYGAHRDLSVYYGGQQALILDYLLPFFLIGCFYLLWRYPSPAFLIPLWIVATAVGNGLLRDTLVSARYYVVLPALALALAAGVRYGLAFFLSDSPLPYTRRALLRRDRLSQAIPMLVVCAIAAAQVGYYFGPHLAFFNIQVRDSKGYRDGIDAALRAAELPGNTQVYLVGKPAHDVNVPRSWLGFLSRDGDPTRYFPLLSVTPDTISTKYLLDLSHGVNYAFFVEPDEDAVLQRLASFFPDADPPRYSIWDIPARKEYVLVYVPSSAIPPSPPRK